jgi:hypothetical protein
MRCLCSTTLCHAWLGEQPEAWQRDAFTVSSGFMPLWEGNSGRKAWQVVHQGISQRWGLEAVVLTRGLDS